MNDLLKFFPYNDLNYELTALAQQFYSSAHFLDRELPDGPEKTVALRKLLEAKDAAYRAKLNK